MSYHQEIAGGYFSLVHPIFLITDNVYHLNIQRKLSLLATMVNHDQPTQQCYFSVTGWTSRHLLARVAWTNIKVLFS